MYNVPIDNLKSQSNRGLGNKGGWIAGTMREAAVYKEPQRSYVKSFSGAM